MNISEEMEQRLVAYADGDLDPSWAAEVEQLLAESDEARRLLAAYRESLAAVKDGLRDPPSGALPSTMRLRGRVTGRRTRRVTLAALAAAAALVLVLSVPRGADAPGPREVFVARQDTAPETSPEALAMTEEERLEKIRALELRLLELERNLAAVQASQEAVLRAQQREASHVDSEREEVAAISVAAGFNMESRYGDVNAALQRYRFAVNHYPETAAAQRAKQRINELTTNHL